MIDKAAAAILMTVQSFRVTFLSAAGITFVLLAAAIFIFVQPRSLVRSAVEIGTFAFNGHEEPIESPELLAKRIPVVYGPAALTAMAKNGGQQWTLGALQNLSADSVGQTVTVQSTIDPAAAEEAKALHQKIIDEIVEEDVKRSDFVREAAALRTVLLKQISDGVDQQITDYAKMLDRVGGLVTETEGRIRDRQLERSTALQRAATQLEADNKAMLDIDGFSKEIAGHVQLLAVLNEDRSQSTRDLTKLRYRHDTLASNLLEAQIAARGFKATRIALAPEVMTQPVGTKRLSLLVISAIASILIAFGAIAFLHSFVVTKA